MKHFFIRLFLIVLFLSIACTGLEEIPAVPAVTLTTGTADEVSNTVTGEILTLGDGIIEHGHVWSSTINTPTVQNADHVTELGEKREPGKYSSSITVDAMTTYVRGYAKDVHGEYEYGEVIPVEEIFADFSVDKDNCDAKCTITFSNTTSPNATTFTWNFGDDTPEADEPSPSHEYTVSGSYQVRLIASSPNIRPDTIVKEVTITTATFAETYSRYSAGKQFDGNLRPRIIQVGENFVVAGTNTEGPNHTIYMIIIDKNGVAGDPKFFEFSGNDELGDMIMLSTGAIVIIGTTYDLTTGGSDILYIKTDPLGNLSDGPKRIRSTPGINESAFDIAEDGCSIFGGCGLAILGQGRIVSTGAQANYITKIKSNGEFDFEGKISDVGGNLGNNATDIVSVGSDFFVCGYTLVPGIHGLLWKLNYKGEVVDDFPKQFNNRFSDVLSSIIFNPSDEIMICGSTSDDQDSDIYLIKTDLNGNPISPFPISFGSFFLDREGGNSLIAEDDNSVVVAGRNNRKAYILKLNDEGEKVWDNEFGGSQITFFTSVLPTSDGGYVFVGSNDEALYVVKTNSEGKLE